VLRERRPEDQPTPRSCGLGWSAKETGDVLRVRDGKVTWITAFDRDVFPAFGLPPAL